MPPRPPNRADTHLLAEWRHHFSRHIWHAIVALDQEHKELCNRFIDIVTYFGAAHPQEREEAEAETDELLEELYEELADLATVDEAMKVADYIYPNGIWEDRYEYTRAQAQEIERRARRSRGDRGW